MDAPDEVVDEIYGAPFDEFVKARDARARELRKEKRRDEADAVKGLKKPALSSWALDQLVRSDRDAVDGLLAAGAALRTARGGDTLRDATREERDAVSDLVSRASSVLRHAGHPVTDKTLSEVRDTLHAAALDDEARDLLSAGRLVEPRRAVGVFGGGGLEAPASGAGKAESGKAGKAESGKPTAGAVREAGSRTRKAGTTRKAESGKRKAAKADDSAKQRRERVAAARSALRDAERSVRERERDLRGLERDVSAAERDLAAAEKALDKRQRAADSARDAVDEAREETARRRAALDEASR